jgi:hypothetical protein
MADSFLLAAVAAEILLPQRSFVATTPFAAEILLPQRSFAAEIRDECNETIV